MLSQSTVASRRSVPQLPPIYIGTSESFLSPSSLAPPSTKPTQPNPQSRLIYPIPTPAPSPANFHVERPKTQPYPPATSRRDEELSALPQPPKSVKQVRSKRSLFRLFNKGDMDLPAESKDSNQPSQVEHEQKGMNEDRKSSFLSSKLSVKSRSRSLNRPTTSGDAEMEIRPKTSGAQASSEKQPPVPPVPGKPFNLTQTKGQDTITERDKGIRTSKSTQSLKTKRSRPSFRGSNDYRDSWKPPPLFQAYPQAIKYSTLPAPPVIFTDSQPWSKITSLRSREEGNLVAEHGSIERPKPKRKASLTQSHSSSDLKGIKTADTQHLHVLVTSGYLLQYPSEGTFDRHPEKVLKLTPKSAAFASDLIPGKHWVLQVVSEMQDDTFQVPTEQRSLLHRLKHHSSSNLTISASLMVFDNPKDMDAWMTTIRREIDILAGRECRQTKTLNDTGGASAEEAPTIDRYRSIKRTGVLPATAPELHSPTAHVAPISPSKSSVPLSPSTINSEGLSNSTGLATSVSEWSSARSSRTSATKSTQTGNVHSSCGFSDPYRLEYTREQIDGSTITPPMLQTLIDDSRLSSSPDAGVLAAISQPMDDNLDYSYDVTAKNQREQARSDDEVSSEFTNADSAFYREFFGSAPEQAITASSGDVPLLSPAPFELAFTQQPRASRRLSKMPPSSSLTNSATSPMESISESTPYFSRRVPDPLPAQETNLDISNRRQDPASATPSLYSSASSPALRSSPRVSMTPSQIRAMATKNWEKNLASSASGTTSRRNSTLFTSSSDGHISALRALTGEAPPVVSSLDSGNETPSRRTSIIQSSKTPRPFRASMQFQQPPPPAPLIEQPSEGQQSPIASKPLRRPPSIRVRNDPAPFVTTVRSAPASRAPSVLYENPSQRSSTAVPILRPPMKGTTSRRQNSLALQNPPQQLPPNIPLPNPPPEAPLPPIPFKEPH